MLDVLKTIYSMEISDFLREKRTAIIMIFILLFGMALFELYIMLNIGELFVAHEGQANLTSPLLFMVVMIANGLFRIAQLYKAHLFVYQLGGYLSKIEFNSLTNSELSSITSIESSELIKRFEVINLVINNVFNPIALFLANIFISTTIIIGAVMINPMVTLYAFVGIAVFYFFTMKFVMPRLLFNSISQSKIVSAKLGYLREIHRGAREILLSSKRRDIRNGFVENETSLRILQTMNLMYGASPRFLFEILLLICGLTFLFSSQLGNSELIGQILPFGYALMKILPISQSLYSNWASIKAHHTMVHEVADSLVKRSDTPKENSGQNINLDGDKPILLIQELKTTLWSAVNFSVKNLELSIGKTYLLVGESGVGKSTFFDVLAGLHNVNVKIKLSSSSGEFNHGSSNWRYLFAIASQEGAILSSTIRENLNWFRTEPAQDEDLMQVLRQLNLVEVLGGLNCLDRVLGEDASNLSGGQRQRLSIARTLLSDRPILMFDEVTSNLDKRNAKKVERLIIEKSKHKICLFISHDNIGDKEFHRLAFSNSSDGRSNPELINE